jgi:hypothetical protein
MPAPLAALLAVLAATAVLTACGVPAPEAADDCTGNCASTPPEVPREDPPIAQEEPTRTFDPGVGRIAMSADGNQHDVDDWASAPMALALIARRNLQANLVHYDFNNHIWDSSDEHLESMTESVREGGERFGFDMSRFFDDANPAQRDAGIKNLVDQINSSTAEDELSIVLAGPMETAWMALDAADPEARKHVRCVSHGEETFNQTHAEEDHGGHSYEDVIDLGCQRVQIPDQNSGFGPTDMDDWDYLKNGDDNLEWLYSRLDLVGNGDVSDAGMIHFVITGDRKGDRSDLRSYFG